MICMTTNFILRFEQEEDDDVDARTPDKMTTKSAPKVISPYMVSNNLPDIMSKLIT